VTSRANSFFDSQPQASSLQQPLTRIHLWGPGSSPKSPSPKLAIYLEHEFPAIKCAHHFMVRCNSAISTFLFLLKNTRLFTPQTSKGRNDTKWPKEKAGRCSRMSITRGPRSNPPTPSLQSPWSTPDYISSPHCVERFGTTYGNGPWSCFPQDPIFLFPNLTEWIVIFTSVSMDRDLSDLPMWGTLSLFLFLFFFFFFF